MTALASCLSGNTASGPSNLADGLARRLLDLLGVSLELLEGCTLNLDRVQLHTTTTTTTSESASATSLALAASASAASLLLLLLNNLLFDELLKFLGSLTSADSALTTTSDLATASTTTMTFPPSSTTSLPDQELLAEGTTAAAVGESATTKASASADTGQLATTTDRALMGLSTD